MDRLTQKGITYCKHSGCETTCPYEDGSCIDGQIYTRLQAYEDAEERGELVRLPCKVGTPVFIIEKYADGNHIVPDMFDYYDLSAFGRTVFLTYAEAETALAKEKT